MTYYERNRERRLAYQKEYSVLNREKIKEYQENYELKREHKIKYLDVKRQYREAMRVKKLEEFNALSIEEQRKIMIQKGIDRQRRREEKRLISNVKEDLKLVSVKVKKNGEIVETYEILK